jgi:type II secretory pathway component GspD/PulD (secretin)
MCPQNDHPMFRRRAGRASAALSWCVARGGERRGGALEHGGALESRRGILAALPGRESEGDRSGAVRVRGSAWGWLLTVLAAAGCVSAEGAADRENAARRRGSLRELVELLEGGNVAAVEAEVAQTEETEETVAQDLTDLGRLESDTAPSREENVADSGEARADSGEAGAATSSLVETGSVVPSGPDPSGATTAAVGTDDSSASQAAPAVEEDPDLDPDDEPEPTSTEPQFSENPYLRFGERIMIHPDGRITKPFPLQAGRGKRLLHLLTLMGDFPFEYTVVDTDGNPGGAERRTEPLPDGWVDIALLEKWDFEQYQTFNASILAAPSEPKDIFIADWLVVTANEERLAEVQAFVELFAGAVPQIEIEARIVVVTTTDELDYGVRGLGGDGVLADFPDGTFVDSLNYNVPNLSDANEALLTIGSIHDGLALDAVLEVIQTWENVTITTQPRIAVREGGVAEVVNTREVPFFSFSGLNANNQNFTASLNFKEVGVKLYASPRVLGTKTLALNLFIEASEQVGTAIAFFDSEGNQFSSPLIAKRQARTVVYLEPGQALVIGGLTSEREVESERKVPFLGDLPLLGLLFRSDLTRKERTNVLFFIRPRILQGYDFNQTLDG